MFDFLSIKKALANYGNQLKAVQADIEQLRRDREDVLFAPPTREDAKAAMKKWVDAQGLSYRASITKGISDLALNRGALENPDRFAEMAARLPLVHKQVYGPVEGPVDLMVYGLFGEAMLKAFDGVLNDMSWPVGALSSDQRNQKLTVIENKLQELVEIEKKLIAAGSDAGISVEMIE